MTLVPITLHYYPELYLVSCVTDKWIIRDYSEFVDTFSTYSGWVVLHRGRVVGYIVLMNHKQYLDIAIHCSVLPEYHGKWMSKAIYKEVFNHIFDTLLLPRCTSWAVDGYGNWKFLERLGFCYEGTIRRGYLIGSQWLNVKTYSMLPEERRWK